MIDGGIITIPLAIALVTLAAGAGAGAACLHATGSPFCKVLAIPVEVPQFDACNGTEDRVFAKWHATQSTNTEATITLTASSGHSQRFQRSVESMTASPSARFALDVLGGVAWYVTRSTGISAVLGQHSEHATMITSYDLLTQESDSLTITCPSGVVWQWILQVDRCGEEPSAVGTRNVRCTRNLGTPPCCLPGYEKDPDKPHYGGCVKTAEGELTRLKSAMCDESGVRASLAEDGAMLKRISAPEGGMSSEQLLISNLRMDRSGDSMSPHAGALLGATGGLLAALLTLRGVSRDAGAALM